MEKDQTPLEHNQARGAAYEADDEDEDADVGVAVPERRRVSFGPPSLRVKDHQSTPPRCIDVDVCRRYHH